MGALVPGSTNKLSGNEFILNSSVSSDGLFNVILQFSSFSGTDSPKSIKVSAK